MPFMGKSISAPKLHQFQFPRLLPSSPPAAAAQLKPLSKPASPIPSQNLRMNDRHMETAENSERRQTLRLAEVVEDCVRRWFQDTLKEAKNGDTSMQVLVGQMYYSGYGVARDAHKGRAWISKASKNRSSVWKVGDKHPGYNASDSDSDDIKEVAE